METARHPAKEENMLNRSSVQESLFFRADPKGQAIDRDDLLNLEILLNICKTVDEFLKAL